jgi:hypothetical protein
VLTKAVLTIRRFAVAVAILTAALGATPAAHSQGCIKYEPAVVTLTGYPTLLGMWGRPNFGEDPAHDEKWIFVVLNLDHEICIDGGDAPNGFNDNMGRVTQVQLAAESGGHFDHRFLLKHVAVTGVVYGSPTGYNLDIIMRWSKVKRIKD